MGLPILIALASLSVQGSPLPISHVETVRSLTTRLERETGRTVEIDSHLAGRPIFVSRGSLPPAGLLKAVALGLRATLAITPKGWSLSRTPADERKMVLETRDVWRNRLVAWLEACHKHERAAAAFGDRKGQISHYQRLLDGQLKDLREKGDTAPITVTVDPNEFSPMGALYRSIVEQIGVTRLIQIEPEERKIWSNRPLGSELSCPSGDDLLSTYDREQHLFQSDPANSQWESAARFTFQQVGGANFRLAVYDSAGKCLARYGGPPFPFAMAGPILLSYSRIAKSSEPSSADWLDLDAKVQQAESFIGERALVRPTPSAQLPLCVKTPDLEDPLDEAVVIGLRRMAGRYTDRGVVFVPTDEYLDIAEGCIVGEKFNAGAFARILESRCERKELDGTVVFRPIDPCVAEHQNVDREKLARQVKLLLSRQMIDMTDIARAYYGVVPGENSRIVERVFGAVIRSQPHLKSSGLNTSGTQLALLGAALASRGTSLGEATVDPRNEPFKGLLNRMVNNAWLKFTSDTPASEAVLDPSAVVDLPQYSPRLALSLDTAPALCPLGLGGNPVSMQDAFFRQVQEVGGMYGSMAASSLDPFNKGVLPREVTRQDILEAIRQFGNYHLGSRLQLNLTLHAFEGVRAQISLEEIRPERDNVGFADLPENIRETLLAAAMSAAAGYGKEPKRQNPPGSTGGSQIPPPP